MMKLFLAILSLGVGLMLWLRIREQRYLKKSSKEALSKGMMQEIEQERETNGAKRRLFLEAMDKAGGRPPADGG